MSESIVHVRVPGGPKGYGVHVAEGLFGRLGDLAGEAVPTHQYAVLADETVAELYGGAAIDSLSASGLRGELFPFPPGEASKSRARWSDLTDRMLAAGFGRDSAVVALGGGVTGDLAAFTASTYMRGIPVIGVPTSLLAMLDSSVGGKTGLDTDAAKNSVGTFHHPALVVIDPGLLRTLPEKHIRAGLAEAVKTAAIRDAELFEWIGEEAVRLRAGDPVRLGSLVRACVRIKADVVGEDPAERGVRQILNFGHTVAHALESLAGYRLLHGEAVGIGMRVAARLGETVGVTREGVAGRLDGVLDACGLPRAPAAGPLPCAADVLEAAGADKKARKGSTRWVLIDRIGEVARPADGSWAHSLPGDRVEAWLDAALRATADVRDSAS